MKKTYPGRGLSHAWQFSGMLRTKTSRNAGSGAAWLARVVWDHEVVGSNPTFPTMLRIYLKII